MNGPGKPGDRRSANHSRAGAVSYGAGSSRGLRGGTWSDISYSLHASYRYYYTPAVESYIVGFRVASVPEPGSICLLVCGLAAGLIWWRRRR